MTALATMFVLMLPFGAAGYALAMLAWLTELVMTTTVRGSRPYETARAIRAEIRPVFHAALLSTLTCAVLLLVLFPGWATGVIVPLTCVFVVLFWDACDSHDDDDDDLWGGWRRRLSARLRAPLARLTPSSATR